MSTKSTELRRLMEQNHHLGRLERQLQTTGSDFTQGLDSAFDAVGISPHLLVAELTSVFPGPQGSVLHIPTRTIDAPGGRKSLFAMRIGQQTVAGIYVVGDQTYERRVTKSTGSSDGLRVGDVFTEKIVDMTGTTVQKHAYTVRAIGNKTGAIYLEARTADDPLDTGDLVNTGDGWCWFCNMGSQWWCGFPCLPGDFGDIFV